MTDAYIHKVWPLADPLIFMAMLSAHSYFATCTSTPLAMPVGTANTASIARREAASPAFEEEMAL